MGSASAAKLGFIDYITVVWFVIDAITHLTIELGYVVLTYYGGARLHDGAMADVWKLYAIADRRWEVVDGGVWALEILTALVIGPLCVLAVWGVLARKAWRHVLQLTISVCELYGGWMTFAPEWLTGNENLRGQPTGSVRDMVLFWVYLLFMNGLWVLVPAVLAADSAAKLTHAADVAKLETHPARHATSGIPAWWYWATAAALVAYVVLIPTVLSFPQLVQ